MPYTSMTNLAAGDLVTETHMDNIRTNIEYLLNPSVDVALRDNSADYTTTSTSFVDVDATNVKATITTYGGPVLVVVTCNVAHTAVAGVVRLDVDMDGTRLGDTDGLLNFVGANGAGYFAPCTIAFIVETVTAGSHTFKLQWKTGGATASMASNNTQYAHIGVIEL